MNCQDVTHSHLSPTAKWAFEGCYAADGMKGGPNGGSPLPGEGKTTDDCYQMCSGHKYFSIQGNRKCVCGNTFGNANVPMNAAKCGPAEYMPDPPGCCTGASTAGKTCIKPEFYRPIKCMCDDSNIGVGKACVYERKAGGIEDIAFGALTDASAAGDTAAGSWKANDGQFNTGVLTNDGNKVADSRSLACTIV